jgi:hypothetical protein
MEKSKFHNPLERQLKGIDGTIQEQLQALCRSPGAAMPWESEPPGGKSDKKSEFIIALWRWQAAHITNLE